MMTLIKCSSRLPLPLSLLLAFSLSGLPVALDWLSLRLLNLYCCPPDAWTWAYSTNDLATHSTTTAKAGPSAMDLAMAGMSARERNKCGRTEHPFISRSAHAIRVDVELRDWPRSAPSSPERHKWRVCCGRLESPRWLLTHMTCLDVTCLDVTRLRVSKASQVSQWWQGARYRPSQQQQGKPRSERQSKTCSCPLSCLHLFPSINSFDHLSRCDL